MKLVYKIGLGILVATNLFFVVTLIYSMIRYDSRVEKNQKFISDTIKEEVAKQIPRTMPNVTGPVYVPQPDK